VNVGPAYELVVDRAEASIQVTREYVAALALPELTLVLDRQVDELRGNLFQQPDHPYVDDRELLAAGPQRHSN
jgi:hypothetical protein